LLTLAAFQALTVVCPLRSTGGATSNAEVQKERTVEQQVVRTGRWDTDSEAFGRRRGVSLLAPAKPTIEPRKPAAESNEDPFGYVAVRLAKPAPVSGQGCPKGEWSDELAPRVRKPGCPCCGSTRLVENDQLERGWECEECGYGSIDSHEMLKDAGPDRQPGDGWFLGSRPGQPAMYRDEDLAAGRIVYHEGEPVMPEVAVVDMEAFPWEWDQPIMPLVGAGGHWTPAEKAARAAKALARAKRDVAIRLAR